MLFISFIVLITFLTVFYFSCFLCFLCFLYLVFACLLALKQKIFDEQGFVHNSTSSAENTESVLINYVLTK